MLASLTLIGRADSHFNYLWGSDRNSTCHEHFSSSTNLQKALFFINYITESWMYVLCCKVTANSSVFIYCWQNKHQMNARVSLAYLTHFLPKWVTLQNPTLLIRAQIKLAELETMQDDIFYPMSHKLKRDCIFQIVKVSFLARSDHFEK